MYKELSIVKKENSKIIKGEWIMPIMLALVVAGTHMRLFSFAALGIAVLSAVFLSEEDMISLLMFLMPFAGVFKSSPASQSFFTYLLLIYVCIKLISASSFDEGFFKGFIIFVAFLVVQMLISVNILRSIKFALNILFLYFALRSETKNSGKKIYLSYIMGMISSSAVAKFNLIANMNDFVGKIEMNVQEIDVERFTGLYGDPNYYSVNIILSLCLVVILNHKKQIGNILSALLAGVLVMFSVMTYSKSAFLMLILPLIMLIYSKIKQKKYLTMIVITVATFVVGNMLLLGKIDAFNVIIARLTESDDLSSLTTNRSDLWILYVNHLIDSGILIVVGNGFGAQFLVDVAAHNTYIDLLYYLGIIGTVMFGVVLYLITKSRKTGFKKNLLNYCPWISIAIMYFFLSELFYYDWAFHVMIAILISKTDLAQVKEGKNDEKICL